MTTRTPRKTPPSELLDQMTRTNQKHLLKVWPYYIAGDGKTLAELADEAGISYFVLRNMATRMRRQTDYTLTSRARPGDPKTASGPNPLPEWALEPEPTPKHKPEPAALAAVEPDEVRLLTDQRDAVVLVFDDVAMTVACKGQGPAPVLQKLCARGFRIPTDPDEYRRTRKGVHIYPAPPIMTSLPEDPTALVPLDGNEAYMVRNPWQLVALRQSKGIAYRVPVRSSDGVRWVEDTPGVEPTWAAGEAGK